MVNDVFYRRITKLCDVMVVVVAVGYRLAPKNRYPLKGAFFSSSFCSSCASCCCCCSAPTSLTSPVVLPPTISSLYEGFRLWWSILANIRVLDESFTVLQDNNETKSQLATIYGQSADILDGRITWRLNNFLVFKDIFKIHKLVSPYFQVRDCSVHICIYRSYVNRVEYLSMCVEGKEFTMERSLQWSRVQICIAGAEFVFM